MTKTVEAVAHEPSTVDAHIADLKERVQRAICHCNGEDPDEPFNAEVTESPLMWQCAESRADEFLMLAKYLGWMPPDQAQAIRAAALKEAAIYCEQAYKRGYRGDMDYECEPQFIADAIRALAATPPGWVAVPAEPTTKMIAAAWGEIRKRHSGKNLIGPGAGFKEAFIAMIKASQEPRT